MTRSSPSSACHGSSHRAARCATGSSLGWEQEAVALNPVVAAEAGADEGDLVPAVVARTLAWTHRLVFRSAFTRLLAGEDQRAVAADLREQARRAYEALEQGLAGYGVKGP